MLENLGTETANLKDWNGTVCPKYKIHVLFFTSFSLIKLMLRSRMIKQIINIRKNKMRFSLSISLQDSFCVEDN